MKKKTEAQKKVTPATVVHRRWAEGALLTMATIRAQRIRTMRKIVKLAP